MEVDISATPEQLAQMIARVESAFSDVQYNAPFRNDTDPEFFEIGRKQVRILTTTLARCGVEMNGLDTCLEFGCGLARATVALSEIFPHVIAVDISAPHVRAAEENARKCNRSNIVFKHVNKIVLLQQLPIVDAFFTRFVLQHNPPPMAALTLNYLLSIVRPGGVGYFQISTYRPGYRFNSGSYLSKQGDHRIAEMHMFPQPELYKLLDDKGYRLLEVREDSGAGGQAISLNVLVMKKC
jgi:SAM-dependent methyltransferase